MKLKMVIYLIIFLLSFNIVFSQDVIKESSPEIKLGEIMEIKIHIYNPSSIEKQFMIIEDLPGNVEVIEPAETFTKMYDSLEIKYYNWRTKVSPNSIKTITYKIKPLSLGVKVILPTQMYSLIDDESLISNPVTFNVKCVPDNKCEKEENSATCPEDCSTGMSDGICDYKADGVCDVDCESEPDCKKSFGFFYLVIIVGILFVFFFVWWISRASS